MCNTEHKKIVSHIMLWSRKPCLFQLQCRFKNLHKQVHLVYDQQLMHAVTAYLISTPEHV